MIAPSALGYDQYLPVQNAIASYQKTIVPCFTALPKDDLTPLEFKIDRTDAYVDLNSCTLQLTVQILNGDGSLIKEPQAVKNKPTPKENKVAPVNNIGYALFEGVDLFIADQKVTLNDVAYPWWTYNYQDLYISPLAKSTALVGNCWQYDGGGFDVFPNLDPANINPGFGYRYAMFLHSKKVKLEVKVMLNRRLHNLLPPQTDVMLRYHRNNPSLCLLAKEGEFKLKIWDANLIVNKVKLTPDAELYYNKQLSSHGFSYFTNTADVRIKTVSKGDQNVEWVPFSGRIPKKLQLWMISHDAYNGKIDKNLYNYQEYRISRLQVFKNGTSLPISTGFVNMQEDQLMSVYQSSVESINSPLTYSHTLFDLHDGYFLVVIDLSCDGNAGNEYLSPEENGTVRIAIDFKEALKESVTLFCLGEFEDYMHIDGNRQITWSSLPHTQ